MLRACRGPRRRTGGNPASGRWGDSLSSPALAVRFHSTLPGARRLPLLQQPRLLSARAPRRRGRLRSLRSWGCASCASPALQLAPRHPAAGAARSGPARHPLLAGHPDPLHPRALPHSGDVKRKTPCTHLGMDGRLSHRLAKLLEGVHWSVGRFGHGVRAAFLLFNNVRSAGSAARVVGHVGTAEAGCCQYQGFLRILKL